MYESKRNLVDQKAREAPRFVVFEGIDGAGKSTQIEMLREYLRRYGYTVVQLEEPTYGKYGGEIRRLIAGNTLPPFSAQTALFTRDRQEHVQQKIIPLLEFTKAHKQFAILQHRYYLSAAAYQAQGQSADELAEIISMQRVFAPDPDLFVILDVPVDEALHRLARRYIPPVLLERRDVLSSARQRYLTVAETPGLPVVIVPAHGSPDQVHSRVLNALGLPADMTLERCNL